MKYIIFYNETAHIFDETSVCKSPSESTSVTVNSGEIKISKDNNETVDEFYKRIKQQYPDVNYNYKWRRIPKSTKLNQRGIQAIAEIISSPVEPEVSQENGGQWKYSKKELPKYYEPVLTYDPAEIDHKELFCVDYIYLDPNKKPHWDMHGDKIIYWMELPEEPKNPSRFSG